MDYSFFKDLVKEFGFEKACIISNGKLNLEKIYIPDLVDLFFLIGKNAAQAYYTQDQILEALRKNTRDDWNEALIRWNCNLREKAESFKDGEQDLQSAYPFKREEILLFELIMEKLLSNTPQSELFLEKMLSLRKLFNADVPTGILKTFMKSAVQIVSQEQGECKRVNQRYDLQRYILEIDERVCEEVKKHPNRLRSIFLDSSVYLNPKDNIKQIIFDLLSLDVLLALLMKNVKQDEHGRGLFMSKFDTANFLHERFNTRATFELAVNECENLNLLLKFWREEKNRLRAKEQGSEQKKDTQAVETIRRELSERQTLVEKKLTELIVKEKDPPTEAIAS